MTKACALIPVAGVNCERNEVQLIHLERLMSRADKTLSTWEQWISTTEKEEFERRVKQLKVIDLFQETVSLLLHAMLKVVLNLQVL